MKPVSKVKYLLLSSDNMCTTLFFTVAPASFAQTRSWLDEQNSFDGEVPVNNMPFFYQITARSLSVERLRRALRSVVLKHSSLRTSLLFDSRTKCLMQRISEPIGEEEELFSFVKTIANSDTDLRTILLDEHRYPSYFNLSNGRVFRVHIIIQKNGDQDFLQTGDVVIFNFHQSAFDLPSLNVFHRDLCAAYECETVLPLDDNEHRYIDCKLEIVRCNTCVRT